MPRTDYHTHTPLCHHAEGEPEAFVARALALDMDAYGIADHMPMPEDAFDDWRMDFLQMEAYATWIERARGAARGHKLRILAGMECDWMPGIEAWIDELRRTYPWDYLIGSVHYLTRHATVDGEECAGHSIYATDTEDWQRYGQAVTDMVKSRRFDMVGHMDLVKIWGRRPASDPVSYFAEALEALEAGGMVVELNTAGWHKKCVQQYPSDALLGELLRRRIPIAINSDAHCPDHLSRDWEKAVQLLDKLCGGKLREYNHPAAHTQAPLHVYGSL